MITPTDILVERRGDGKPKRKKKTGKQRGEERQQHRSRRRRELNFLGKAVCMKFEGRWYRMIVGTDEYRSALNPALQK